MSGEAQTQLIPIGHLSPGQAGSIRNEIVKQVVAEVGRQLNLEASRLVVRDIRPSGDLSYTYEDWQETSGTSEDAYETMDTGTVADGRWIAIYGVKIDPPSAGTCTKLKFSVGGSDKVIWMLQHLREEDGYEGICNSAIIMPQNTIYTFSRYVREASAPATIILLGVVIEPRGKVVSP